jgi:hypothetical protein
MVLSTKPEVFTILTINNYIAEENVVKVNHRNLDTSLIANLNCININPNPSYFPSLDGRG